MYTEYAIEATLTANQNAAAAAVRAPSTTGTTGLQNHLSGGDPDAIVRSRGYQHPHPLFGAEVCIEECFLNS